MNEAVLIVILFFISTTHSAKFGDLCNTLQDCICDGLLKVTGVECQWASSSCGHGFCTCSEGFREDQGGKRCRREIGLGQFCSVENGDICSAPNAICDNGVCRCHLGYRSGPKHDDCLPEKMTTLKYGDSCYYRIALFHDAFCPYNMVCTPRGCDCPPGFKINADNKFSCEPINLGDHCRGDGDCSQNVYSVCSTERNSTCICKRGFRLIRFLENGNFKHRCVRRNARFLGEGDYCGNAFPYDTPFIHLSSTCSEQLNCVACRGHHSPAKICGVPSKEQKPSPTAIIKYDKRKRLLGDRCDNIYRAECILKNTDCINGICQCLPGSGCVYTDYSSSADIFDLRRDHALVGEPCSVDIDCSRDGSMICQSASPTCKINRYGRVHQGTCACSEPNYVERPYITTDSQLKKETLKTCAKRLRIGEICSKSRTQGRAVCSAKNSDCLYGVCQCVMGFKMAPWGDECIPEEQMRYYGEQCLFSEECYYSENFESPMACLDNTCGCLAGSRPGMISPDGPAYGCESNRLGDRCMADSDCHLYWQNNWHCNPDTQRCECNKGYYAAKIDLRDGRSQMRWCVPYAAQLQAVGETCSQNINGVVANNRICSPPLVCSSCGDSSAMEGICGWQPQESRDVPFQILVQTWWNSQTDGASCLATPIDSGLKLLLLPANCIPQQAPIKDPNYAKNPELFTKLNVKLTMQIPDGRNVTVEPESVIRHPVADLALLRYKISDNQSYIPMPVELPTPAHCHELYNCSIEQAPQWFPDTDANVHRTAQLIAPNQCQNEYGSSQPITKGRNVCAGRFPSEVGRLCQRVSSHGPLMCQTPHGNRVIAGVPIQLTACAIAAMPQIFTNVCAALDWINYSRMILNSMQNLAIGSLSSNATSCPR